MGTQLEDARSRVGQIRKEFEAAEMAARNNDAAIRELEGRLPSLTDATELGEAQERLDRLNASSLPLHQATKHKKQLLALAEESLNDMLQRRANAVASLQAAEDTVLALLAASRLRVLADEIAQLKGSLPVRYSERLLQAEMGLRSVFGDYNLATQSKDRAEKELARLGE